MRLKLTLFLLSFSQAVFGISPQQLVKDARSQIGVTKYYDAKYSEIAYLMGDVPMIKGVCTDVVIRALRKQNVDLQQLIHQDMAKHFKQYPQKWNLKTTDRNIDHRRVPNIETYFKRRGFAVTDRKFEVGDIVIWDLGKGQSHIGIVSDKTTVLGTPLIIHNINSGTKEENVLYRFKITGHFRYKADK